MTIAQESPYEALDLLQQSVAYIRSLYPEEHGHDYKLDELTSNGARFFIARRNFQIIGCGAYVWIGVHLMEIKHMYVAPEARGTGCGGSLLTIIEQHAHMDKAERIVLETSQKQEAAIRLYRSFGYTNCAPYTAGHDEDVFMHKLLR